MRNPLVHFYVHQTVHWDLTYCGLMFGMMVAVFDYGISGRAPLSKVRGTPTYQGKAIAEPSIIFHCPTTVLRDRGRIVDGEIKDVTTFDVLLTTHVFHHGNCVVVFATLQRNCAMNRWVRTSR